MSDLTERRERNFKMVEMINKAMGKFRLASRELYNNYFFNDDPAASHEDFYLPPLGFSSSASATRCATRFCPFF